MRKAIMAAVLAVVAGTVGAQDLPGASWQAIAVADRALTPDDGVTLIFGDGRIAGRAGCNQYTGAAGLTALTPAHGTLTPGAIASTRMLCPDPAMEVETAVLAALGRATAWRITPDGTLELWADDQVLIRARPM